MRPLPRYVLAIMAAFVAFELWIPLLAIVIRALVGPTVPTAVQAVVPLFGLAVPAVVGLALSDYLADRQGLVRPYQPKRRPSDPDENEEPEELDEEDEDQEEPEEDKEEADDQGLEEQEEGETAADREPGRGDDATGRPTGRRRHAEAGGDNGSRDGRTDP